MIFSSVDELWKRPVSFLGASGPDGDIAISSRIRLARNLKGLPFPAAASAQQLEDIAEEISAAAARIRAFAADGAFSFIPETMSEPDRRILMERRLVSKEFLARKSGTRLLVCPQEACSLMVNEEDQLRLQVIRPGLQLEPVWREITALDDELADRMEFAFDEQLGYLTSCPTNVGTGMRVSVMLHLPALVMVKQMGPTVHGIGKLNLAVRGIFGEGSENLGCLFQVSNQSTLGQSEPHIIADLSRVIRQLIGWEKMVRREFLEHQNSRLLDYVGRAYGLLKYSYTLTEKEALNSLSGLRLGVDLGLFKDVDLATVNELFVEVSPAHLRKMAGLELPDQACDEFRAAYCRKKLRQTRREG